MLEKKKKAVEVEDFDLAIELKEITDKLKLLGSDLNLLDQRKQDAIDGEDFETAKALKMQMEKLKTIVANLDPENPFAQLQSMEMGQPQVTNNVAY